MTTHIKIHIWDSENKDTFFFQIMETDLEKLQEITQKS